MSTSNNKFKDILIKWGIGLVVASVPLFFIYRYYRRKRATKRPNITSDNNETPEISKNTFSSDYTNTLSESFPNSSIHAPLDEVKTNKVLSKLCENVLNNLVLAYDVIREDYDFTTKKFKNTKPTIKEFTLEKFKLGILENIQKENVLIYDSLQVTYPDYIKSLSYYVKVKQHE